MKRKTRATLIACMASVLSMMALATNAYAIGWEADEAFDPLGVRGAGLTIDQATGNIYVVNFSTNNPEREGIRQFDSDGEPLGQFGGGLSGRNFRSVTLNTANQDVYAYDPFGSLVVFQSGIEIEELSGLATEFGEPNGNQLTSDSSGNLYLTQPEANSVVKLDEDGDLLLTITGEGEQTLSGPRGIALAADGSIYVTDTTEGGRVQKFDSSGDYVSTLESGNEPMSLAIDKASGNIFVLSRSGGYHVVVYDSAGAELTEFGLGTIQNDGFTANQIAVNETSKNVYVTDGASNVVWTFEPVQAPTATSGAATAVTSSGATLNGIVNPNGSAVTDCHFAYGTTTAYGSTAPCVPASPGGGTSPVAVTAKVSGLQAQTGYHFKLVTENGGGEAEGADAEFTTLANAPTAATGAASGVTQTTATIAGTINPNGATSSCYFEYGTSTAYGAKVPCPTDPGSGSGAVAESLNLAGLTAGTTYHYRLVATNAGGTTNGANATFTTEAAPNNGGGGGGGGTTQPPTTTPPTTPPVTPKPLKCKKGFKKKTVKGKAKCVKVKKKPKKAQGKK